MTNPLVRWNNAFLTDPQAHPKKAGAPTVSVPFDEDGVDSGFASVRQVDVEENRQRRWDWGGARTWFILAVLFFGFLIFAHLIYTLPHGRDASPPSIKIY